MDMIKLVIKPLVRAMACTVIVSATFFCKMTFSADISIGGVSKSIYTGTDDDKTKNLPEYESCKDWSLTASQVKRIFDLSTKYPDNSVIVNDYYWLPCYIDGWLVVDGVRWDFSINAGATAQWHNDSGKIFMGCKKEECDSFFLLPYNAMSDGPLN
ncbi:hypothetical protein CDR68_23185 [Salmonella enterica]|nr:hypothetical protein [Salmonella enterica]